MNLLRAFGGVDRGGLVILKGSYFFGAARIRVGRGELGFGTRDLGLRLVGRTRGRSVLVPVLVPVRSLQVPKKESRTLIWIIILNEVRNWAEGMLVVRPWVCQPT